MLYKRLFFSLAIVFIFSAFLFAITPNISASTIKDQVCEGITATGGACDTAGADTQVNNLVTTIINLFSWIVGIVAVIMVIFGGFRYITAAGDTGKTKTARDTIIYALIGLVIVALAQVIVSFVITRI